MITVLLYREVTRKGMEPILAVREIRVPFMGPGIGLFVDPGQDPEEPTWLYWSRGEHPVLVAQYREILDEYDLGDDGTHDSMIEYLSGSSNGWQRVESFMEVYKWSDTSAQKPEV